MTRITLGKKHSDVVEIGNNRKTTAVTAVAVHDKLVVVGDWLCEEVSRRLTITLKAQPLGLIVSVGD